MKSLLLRLLLGVFALGFVATSGFAQTHSGAIKALKVSGAVTRVDKTGATSVVTDGIILTESDTIITGDNSGVVLVFMNGSSVKLGAKSRLLVEQFKMDPLAGDINVATLKKEPSVSQTTLNLTYGELVGDVKKLNKSSTYNIKTAVGAAGIRGTIFRIVMTPSSDGKTYTFQLATAEGLVVFTGTLDNSPVDVPGGTQVDSTADVDATGAIAPSGVTKGDIGVDVAFVITGAVDEIIQQAQQAGSFTPTEQSVMIEAAGAQSISVNLTVEIPAPPTATVGGTGGTTVDKDGKPVVDGSPSN